MNNDLNSHKVIDRKTFVEFLELLREDFIKNPDDWVNKSVPDYLEAMSNYVEDIQGYYDNTNQNVNAEIASWKVFSDIFQGAKMQE